MNRYRMTKLKLSEFEMKVANKTVELENGKKVLEKITKKNDNGDEVATFKYQWNTNTKVKNTLSKTIIKMRKAMEEDFEKEIVEMKKDNIDINEEIIKNKKEEFTTNFKTKLKSMVEKSKVKIDNSNKITIRDTELIRIIRSLNLEDNSTEENGYTYIKDLICVSVSIPTYKSIDDGIIEFNHTKMKRLLASSGNVRNKKVIFINEKLYDNAMKILLCGLPPDMEHEQISKYNAYMGLPNSDTIPVSTPQMVVIDDYTRINTEIFDVVIKGTDGKFDVIPNQKKEFSLMPFDGAGLVDISQARKWSRELNLLKLDKETGINKIDYIPSSFQFRAIIGIKGNLYTMDIKKYALSLEEDKRYITDVWGIKYPILDANENLLITAILTKSQFKFKKHYESFNKWKFEFDKEVELKDLDGNDITYKRTFNIAKWGNKKNKEKALLSYQPIQSLELTSDQISTLCKPTVEMIKNISTNVNEFLKYRGLIEESIDELGNITYKDTDMERVPLYYQALKENKDLFFDSYIQKKVQVDIDKFKNNAMKGMVFVDGNFQTMSPDTIGFMQYATGQEVVGVVPKNSVYSNYWREKEYISFEENEDKEKIEKIEKVTAVDIIRFPHVSNEHIFATVMQNEVEEFQYIKDGIIMSIHDCSLERLGNGDEDGDRILTIPNIGENNKVIVDNAKEQQTNTIYFINEYEKDKKENEEELISQGEMERPKPIKINKIDKLIECDCNGMEASIGKVVNKISILWSLPKSPDRDKYIKIMSVIGSLTIDYVKTGILEPIPQEIEKFLVENEKMVNKKVVKEYYKKPTFLKVKYKEQELKEKRINKNLDIFDIEEKVELFSDIDCTMNRLYHHIEKELDKIKLSKPKGDFDFTSLIHDKINVRNATYPLVLEKIKELKKEHDDITQENSIDIENYSYDSDKKVEQYDKFRYFYKYCKNELALINKETSNKKDKLIDYIVYAFYVDEDFALKNEAKDLLWNVFGTELKTRLSNKEFRKGNEEFNVIELETKRKELLDKKEKPKDRAKKVCINGIDTIADESKVKVDFYKQNTFKKIDETDLSKQSKKVLKVLIMLDLIFKNHNKSLLIGQSRQKNINRSIISKFTGINGMKIDECLKELKNKGFVELEVKTDKITLECIVNFHVETTGNKVKIKDSESIFKHIK